MLWVEAGAEEDGSDAAVVLILVKSIPVPSVEELIESSVVEVSDDLGLVVLAHTGQRDAKTG